MKECEKKGAIEKEMKKSEAKYLRRKNKVMKK